MNCIFIVSTAKSCTDRSVAVHCSSNCCCCRCCFGCFGWRIRNLRMCETAKLRLRATHSTRQCRNWKRQPIDEHTIKQRRAHKVFFCEKKKQKKSNGGKRSRGGGQGRAKKERTAWLAGQRPTADTEQG